MTHSVVMLIANDSDILIMLMFQDDVDELVSASLTPSNTAGDECNDQSKLFDAKKKKRTQDAVVNDAISDAVQSIDKLVSAVVQRNSIRHEHSGTERQAGVHFHWIFQLERCK